MPPVWCANGTAVLVEDGLRFDLGKVLDACVRLIDACAGNFGAPIIRMISEVCTARLPWPDPGKEAFLSSWRKAGIEFDAVAEPMVAVFDALCLKIFPLGQTWCVHRPRSDELVTPSGKPISELDPSPGIMVYGPETGLNSFEVASPGIVEALERLLDGPLSELACTFRKSEPVHVSTDMKTLGQFASIGFPHAVYGAGRGPIRVRCVTDND